MILTALFFGMTIQTAESPKPMKGKSIQPAAKPSAPPIEHTPRGSRGSSNASPRITYPEVLPPSSWPVLPSAPPKSPSSTGSSSSVGSPRWAQRPPPLTRDISFADIYPYTTQFGGSYKPSPLAIEWIVALKYQPEKTNIWSSLSSAVTFLVTFNKATPQHYSQAIDYHLYELGPLGTDIAKFNKVKKEKDIPDSGLSLTTQLILTSSTIPQQVITNANTVIKHYRTMTNDPLIVQRIYDYFLKNKEKSVEEAIIELNRDTGSNHLRNGELKENLSKLSTTQPDNKFTVFPITNNSTAH